MIELGREISRPKVRRPKDGYLGEDISQSSIKNWTALSHPPACRLTPPRVRPGHRGQRGPRVSRNTVGSSSSLGLTHSGEIQTSMK